MIPFNKESNLLIGTLSPAGDTDNNDVKLKENMLVCQARKPFPQIRTFSQRCEKYPRFIENLKCGLDFKAFLRDKSHQIRIAGTADARYLPESYQMNFTAGKYVSVGGGKTFKRRPASTMKHRIVEYCSKPIASLKQILELRVGLEVSACSGNAQRISLWHALMMAYGKSVTRPEVCKHGAYDPACAETCWGLGLPGSPPDFGDRNEVPHTLLGSNWTKEAREFISGLIGELSLTGLLDDGELHCLVPPCQVLTKAENP